jgi:hypothetical protein
MPGPIRAIQARSLLLFLILLLPGSLALGQGRDVRTIITLSLSQTINWLPENDSIVPFRQSNDGTAESLATLGSEIALEFEWFPVEGLSDSMSVASIQLVTGYLQRGYRMVIAGSNECLREDVYRTKASWLRIALFGRDNIPLARKTHLHVQLGGTYGALISAFDNIDEVQICRSPTTGVESVLPRSFFEVGGGVGVRNRISPALIGSFNVLYFYPVASSKSTERPATTGEARSLLTDIRTPNLSLNLGIGVRF